MLIRVIRLFLLLIAVLILFPTQVEALGIGVAPHKLELEVYPFGSATSSLNIFFTDAFLILVSILFF